MHRSVLATLMLAAALAACAMAPATTEEPVERSVGQHGSVTVIGHHCDGGQGVDALALHVEGPGEVVVRWNNEGVCGKPS